MNKPTSGSTPLPWSKEEFQQMVTMLEVTIPMQEDNLRRAAASGLDVTALTEQLQKHKSQLQSMITAWKDKYK